MAYGRVPAARPETQEVFRRLEALGLSQGQLAEAVGLDQDKVSKTKSGVRQFKGEELIAAQRWLDRQGEADERPDHQPTITVDGGETAPVLRLDLSYSMGPGRTLDDSYIESEAFAFDIGFLRSMTVTPPDRIRIVDGIGDSMTPTLHDRDLLFVDVNQAELNAQDRIWAIWLFGLGAVKRLRAIDAERVLVISDNPNVENQVVQRSDILIHGRVVGSIKRH